jgi:AraC-like DNA-binding protein
MSSSQVAHALGYESEAFFARQFKQKRGRTPGEERRR